MFDATEVVPINFVFFTASAIVAGTSAITLSLTLWFRLSGSVVPKPNGFLRLVIAFCFPIKRIRQMICSMNQLEKRTKPVLNVSNMCRLI